jgi:hypothetical protein
MWITSYWLRILFPISHSVLIPKSFKSVSSSSSPCATLVHPSLSFLYYKRLIFFLPNSSFSTLPNLHFARMIIIKCKCAFIIPLLGYSVPSSLGNAQIEGIVVAHRPHSQGALLLARLCRALIGLPFAHSTSCSKRPLSCHSPIFLGNSTFQIQLQGSTFGEPFLTV